MRISKRFLSLALCLAMVFSMFAALGIVSSSAAASCVLEFNFNDLEDGSISDRTGHLTVSTPNGTVAGLNSGDTALQFDGSDETFLWAAQQYDPLAQCTDGMTMVMWVKADSVGGWRHIFNYGNANAHFGGESVGFTGNYLFMQLDDTNKNLRLNASYNTADNSDGSLQKYGNGTTFGTGFVGEWKMVTVTEDGNGTFTFYEDGQLQNSFTLEYTLPNIVARCLERDPDGDSTNYSLFAPQGSLWESDNGFVGAVQSFSIYNGVLTQTEIGALYDSAFAIDSNVIASVETQISNAVSAPAGSDVQLAALSAATQAYGGLNVKERAAVSNAADLASAQTAYLNASGNLLSFEFNGSLQDLFGRATLNGYAAMGGISGQGTLALNGTNPGFWTKAGGFYRRDYNPFADADALTVEMAVKPASYSSYTDLIGYSHGDSHKFRLQASDTGTLHVFAKVNDGTEIHVEMPDAAPALDQWSVITLTQEKADSVTTTLIYVNGALQAASTDLPLLGDMMRTGTEDDVFCIGTSDLSTPSFNGEIDYFRVFAGVKTFSTDPLVETVSGTAVVPADTGAYDLTWNVDVTNRLDDADAQDFVEFNAQYTILDTGVIIAATAGDAEDAKALAASEDTAIAGKAYQESFGTTLYSHFSYRRMNVAAGRTRYVVAYTVYTDGENTYYAYTDASPLVAVD